MATAPAANTSATNTSATGGGRYSFRGELNPRILSRTRRRRASRISRDADATDVYAEVVIDQAEIDALLAGAGTPGPEASTVGAAAAAASTARIRRTPDVERILRIRVPIIVQLAQSTMTMADIRNLSLGKILQFSQPIEKPLELHINNECIGFGDAVRVKDSYGLRITSIRDSSARIKSLGGTP